MDRAEYERMTAATRAQRMQWWQEARFGMFVHWGLYAQLGRHEWVMNRERIPVTEYEKLAATWKPKERPAREWARLAKQAGMNYMVMTTKHHEGFCLWDTKQTDYNAARRGPGRDLVAEYVDACHEFGLRVGFYYSLMDWHNPDGAVMDPTSDAHKRFLDFTKGCVRELCSNYGKLDILWYDVAWPGRDAEWWDSVAMNTMARELQPDLIINNRSHLDEDLGTPEEHVTAEKEGRNWEACMTFNGSWGYMPSAIDWRPVREVISMLLALKSMGAVVLTIALKQQLSREGYYWYNLPKAAGFPFLALVEHTNFLPPEKFGGNHIIYCGDYLDPEHEYFQLSQEELLQRFLPSFKRINPDFEEDWITGSWLVKTNYAQPVPLLNHSRNIPSIKTPLNGLYFASMSQVYPWDRGTNFAVEIARRAAATMLNRDDKQ